jgi:hypothetical protein
VQKTSVLVFFWKKIYYTAMASVKIIVFDRLFYVEDYTYDTATRIDCGFTKNTTSGANRNTPVDYNLYPPPRDGDLRKRNTLHLPCRTASRGTI